MGDHALGLLQLVSTIVESDEYKALMPSSSNSCSNAKKGAGESSGAAEEEAKKICELFRKNTFKVKSDG